MARFTCGGSPSRKEATPISSPRSFTTALPLHDGLAGAITMPRSSMYSQAAENRPVSRPEPGPPHEVVALVSAHRPRQRAGQGITRLAQRGHRPRSLALELHDAEPGLQIEAD